jgi:hypothetical protein
MSSFHIDLFIYKSKPMHFARFFEIITSDDSLIEKLLSDRRSSRAYEACLLCLGDKLSSIKEETANKDDKTAKDISDQDDLLKKLKKILKKFSNYLVDKFDHIIDTQDGIYSLRAFLRIIGNEDPLEQSLPISTNKKPNRRKEEFNMKNINVKLVPTEWNMNKLIKKFAKSVLNLNLLGRYNTMCFIWMVIQLSEIFV